jgi:hypothetical protein
MTGWDTPSRPTWDPQDGPDDGRQGFSAPDASPGDNDPWATPAGSGWGASTPTGGSDFGGSDFGGPGADDATAGPPDEFFPREFEQRTPGASLRREADAPSWDLPVRDSGRGSADRNGSGPQAAAWEQAPAWDEPQWPDAQRQEYPRQDEYGRQDLPRRDQARPDQTRQDLDRPEFGTQGFGPQDPAREEFPRRQPGSAYPPQQDYAAQQGYPSPLDAPTQQGQGDQAPAEQASPDWVMAARMDPALQDFFAPTAQGRGPAPRPGQGPQGRQEPQEPHAPLGSQAPQGSQGSRAPRDPQAPARPVDPWDDAPGFQPSGPSGPTRGGSGGSGSYNRADDRKSPGRASRIAAVTVVVVVVVAVGAYLLIHKTGNSNVANSNITPTVGASAHTAVPTPTAKAKASAKTPRVSGTASADAWLLSAPSVAGGYPIGTDPHFLAITTTTAATIEQSAVGNSGGKVTGNPVSASYTLPAEQTIEFVGYQGTFNPKTVMKNLASFGTSEATYPAGPHGGKMACANVPATASATSGGVCVWVTATTLGVTEFFTQSAGPEVLTVAQSKGADDTVSLRASVEARKSS